MSSVYDKPADLSTAEAIYWDAFDRLRFGRPELLPKGTKVSQNNVAKEADRDPSALKKERFPRVIRAIQRWVEEFGGKAELSKRQEKLAGREKARSLKDQLASCKAQRDIALSKLVEADAKILELAVENLRLQALNATNIKHIAEQKSKRAGR